MFRLLTIAVCAFFPGATFAQSSEPDAALMRSVAQLRSTVGQWNVTTEFLKPDGAVARSVTGTYEFDWVVPDRVVSGTSRIPELKQTAGILFYIDPERRMIEMVSVGADGKLWIMTGALGEELRTTKEFKTAHGGTGMLRFTRFNVSHDSFESKMEFTEDGGRTWQPGNHQTFRRARASTP
jgi:hypothetical protein